MDSIEQAERAAAMMELAAFAESHSAVVLSGKILAGIERFNCTCAKAIEARLDASRNFKAGLKSRARSEFFLAVSQSQAQQRRVAELCELASGIAEVIAFLAKKVGRDAMATEVCRAAEELTRVLTAKPVREGVSLKELNRLRGLVIEHANQLSTWLADQIPESVRIAETAIAQDFDKATIALAILAKAKSSITVKEIAAAVGTTDKYLYKHPVFGPAWRAFKDANSSATRIRRGSKSKDGTIEAVDEVDFDPD